MNADKIAVIDGGRVVEEGNHASLVEKSVRQAYLSFFLDFFFSFVLFFDFFTPDPFLICYDCKF